MLLLILLVIIGIKLFCAPISPSANVVLLVIYVVLIMGMLLGGTGVFALPHWAGAKW